jgi:NitT/TauT family transport system ATP-binding protein
LVKEKSSGASDGRTILKAVNLGFLYENQYKVFHHINIDVPERRFVSITGPSGVGKSTLLRNLGGFVAPSEGEVLLLGKKVVRPTPKISLIHQSIVTFPWMTALENVALSVKSVKKVSQEEAEKIARRMLELVGLRGFEDFYPKEMSGGMRQRIAIARAMAVDPVVLLMDEPFSHLDELTAEGLRNEVYNILFNEESSLNSVVMVSHNLKEIVELSDIVYVMNGRPAEIVGEIYIDLPRPRKQDDHRFSEYMDKLFSLLTPIPVKGEKK